LRGDDIDVAPRRDRGAGTAAEHAAGVVDVASGVDRQATRRFDAGSAVDQGSFRSGICRCSAGGRVGQVSDARDGLRRACAGLNISGTAGDGGAPTNVYGAPVSCHAAHAAHAAQQGGHLIYKAISP